MNIRILASLSAIVTVASTLSFGMAVDQGAATEVDTATMKAAVEIEQGRQEILNRVSKAYVFIGGGSGVVISPDGYILTNDHVAGERRDWRVRMTDGRSYKARVTGTDPISDITVLKMENPPEGLTWLKLGDSDKLEVGQTVIAVGNPFGLGDLDDVPTVTFGIISSLHRYQGNYSDAIMTDVALNPGNSGGPLITLQGEVVGINGRIASRFGVRANSGIGYAIPSNQIKPYLDAFKKANGFYVFRAQIEGLVALRLQSQTEREFIVHRVEAGSEAEKAGFHAEDVVTAINGHKLAVANRFYGELANLPPGQSIPVTVRRVNDEGQTVEKTITVLLTHKPIEEMNDAAAIHKTLGLTLPPPAGDRADERERQATMTVKEVKKGQAAELCGLQKGDLLKDINGVNLTSQEDWIREYTKLQIGEKYPITILRDGKEIKLTLIPDLKRTGNLYE
ncbi:MAG TPA: trypsin-like peptidase domain-containing protein [Planctomycetota bacterium]|nr:trypsin-like peptidase domain-containing protein [Planctomycetota bacterium]